MDLDLLRAVYGPIVSISGAARLGIDRRELARAAHSGAIERLANGWYSTGPIDHAEARHLLRSVAQSCAHGPSAALGHHSALAVRNLPTWSADLETVRMCQVGCISTRRSPGLAMSGPWPCDPEVLEIWGHRVWALPTADAIVQFGLSARPEAAMVSADRALAEGLITQATLASALTRGRGRPGIARLIATLAWADGRHESVGESRTAFAMRLLGYSFTPQVEVVVRGRRYRPDFIIDGELTIVEFDGAVKYADRATLLAEKAREDDLRSVGYSFARIGWRDLDDLAIIAAKIERARALGRRSA